MGGYLLGQVVAGILVRYDLLSGLTLNYSSLSAVTSTLVIMATVILSTIYPARKASQMAVPDVTRKWVIPEPRGDRWEFDFPFTVGGLEVLGLCTFLKDYFASCGEESIGNFYTAGAQFSTSLTGEERAYVVKMNVWLAPYDLGVSQSVVLEAAPMGEYGIYAIRLLIERSSGEVGDWKRLNRQFLNTMRKQFLVWRTVSPEVKEEYRAEGEKLIQK